MRNKGAWLLAALLSLSACSNEEDNPNENNAVEVCTENTDCPTTAVCQEGVCAQPETCEGESCPCEVDADCSIGFNCIDFTCAEHTLTLNPPERCPSGASDAFGICSPTAPAEAQLTPPEGCPGDTSEEGICLPMVNHLKAWAELPTTCTDGEMPTLEGCAPIGLACPTDGAWHDETTIRGRAPGFGGELVFVRAGAGEGEPDGTMERPFGSITAALDAAQEGDIVAVGVGQYNEAFATSTRLAVVGACVEQVAVVSPERDQEAATITLNSPQGALISDLRVSGDRPGIRVEEPEGADAQTSTIQSVWVDRALRAGLWVEQSLNLTDIMISGTRPKDDGNSGRGLHVVAGSLVVERAAFVRNHEIGVGLFNEGTRATLTNVIVADTQPQESTGNFGRGISVGDGAAVEMERAAFVRNHEIGVGLFDEGARVALIDVLVAETLPQASTRTFGQGIAVRTGATLDLERAAILRNHNAGVLVLREGTRATLTDVHIEDTQLAESMDEGGFGLLVGPGSVVEVKRAASIRNHDVGVLVTNPGARLTMTDVLVADTQPSRDGFAGFGLYAESGAVVEVERGAMLRNRIAGVLVVSPGSRATLTDVRVADTLPHAVSGDFGRGVVVELGVVEVERAAVINNRDAGFYVGGGGSEATLTDIVIADTQRGPGGLGGRGLVIQGGAAAEVTRGAMLRNHEIGAFVGGGGLEATVVKMHDIHIADTQPDANGRGGHGLNMSEAVVVEVERGTVVNNHDAGIFLHGAEAQATLTDVRVEDTQPRPSDSTGGRGLTVQVGATAEVARGAIIHNHELGVFVGEGGAAATMTDVLVADTQPQPETGRGGAGLHVQSGSVEVTRGSFERNHTFGIIVHNQSTATMTDVQIVDTLKTTNRTTQELLGGVGMAVVLGSHVDLLRFGFWSNALAGLMLARQATLQGTDGVIADNFIGLNLQVDDIDLDEAFVDVSIYGNCCGGPCDVQTCNVESQELHIPEPAEALDVIEDY